MAACSHPPTHCADPVCRERGRCFYGAAITPTPDRSTAEVAFSVEREGSRDEYNNSSSNTEG